MSKVNPEISLSEPQRSSIYIALLIPLTVGLVVGAVASWALLFAALDAAEPWINTFLRLVLPATGIASLVLAFIFIVVVWGVRRFFKNASGTLEQFTKEVANSVEAATENKSVVAVGHARQAVLELLAWYGPIAGRKWVVQTALALLLAFGGLFGTALLFRQTLLLGQQNEKIDQQINLLRDQNEKIDLQTVTAEAQRRSGLATELFSILQTVSLLEAKGEDKSEVLKLKPGLKARVVAFTLSAISYWTISVVQAEGGKSVPKLADRSRSPERGQMLIGLRLAGVHIPSIENANFAEADLRLVNLSRADLRKTFLMRADLKDATLTEANLEGANLMGADFQGAELKNANLRYANLFDAKLQNSTLSSADLSNTDLRGASLHGAHLDWARLERANLNDAYLPGADLSNARLMSAQLQGSNLKNAILSEAILLNASMNHADLSRASFINADLTGVSFEDADLTEVLIGMIPLGRRPIGWTLPDGWEEFTEDLEIRLRRKHKDK